MSYTYVTFLSSDDDELYLNTLILGVSIKNTETHNDIILLHDFNVPEYKIDILRKYFTKLISVKNISLVELFKLKDYEKIIYINNNSYVNKNIDKLFDYNTPMARITNDNIDTSLMIFNPSEKFTKNTIFNTLEKKYNYYVMGDSDNSNNIYNSSNSNNSYNSSNINNNSNNAKKEYNYINNNIYVINYNNVTSPAKYRPLQTLLCRVLKLISSRLSPPQVTNSSLNVVFPETA